MMLDGSDAALEALIRRDRALEALSPVPDFEFAVIAACRVVSPVTLWGCDRTRVDQGIVEAVESSYPGFVVVRWPMFKSLEVFAAGNATGPVGQGRDNFAAGRRPAEGKSQYIGWSTYDGGLVVQLHPL
jgi:hypothetical protein